MAVSRIQIASNKKSALLKQSMREIAVMLAEEPPKEEKAKIRGKHWKKGLQRIFIVHARV